MAEFRIGRGQFQHTRYRGQGRKDKRGDQRCTPPEVWEQCLKAVHLCEWDLDPASNEFATVPAVRKLCGRGLEDNGFAVTWYGHVWCNPPFSQLLKWAWHALRELEGCKSITFLGPGDMSTDWWHLLARNCDAWGTPEKRYHFPIEGNPKGSPPGPIVIFYFGSGSTHWVRIMREAGWIAYSGHPVE